MASWRLCGSLVLGLLSVVAVSPTSARPLLTAHRLEVSLARHRLYEYIGGVLRHTYPITTGSGRFYFSHGRRHVASTPRGYFHVLWKRPGWVHSSLGWLYFPLYFHRAGYAIHGGHVARSNVSHGCVRVPVRSVRGLYRRTPVKTPVIVY